jgi:sigma-B regulation protein RsbU (phosphoserine phosphatase)
MDQAETGVFRQQLLERRGKIVEARAAVGESADLARLLGEVDAALDRVARGTFGICDACHESIEHRALAADPLLCLCLEHLSPEQRRALERDLELASAIQTRLLPDRDLRFREWAIHYHYRPAALVSGDFCDLVADAENERVFFALGDASGKGVAASLLMSHLQATFRTLLSLGAPVAELMTRANRIFCTSTLESHYATAACGFVRRSGEVEIVNAGHCPPLVVRAGGIESVPAAGLPLGLFCNGQYSASVVALDPADCLVLYSDGITEARNGADAEYGADRLAALAAGLRGLAPGAIVRACLGDLDAFLAGARQGDDVTLMVIQRQNGVS